MLHLCKVFLARTVSMVSCNFSLSMTIFLGLAFEQTCQGKIITKPVLAPPVQGAKMLPMVVCSEVRKLQRWAAGELPQGGAT